MNSWQQPVTNEPSFGTFHLHFNASLSSDPADTNWHELDLSAQVPVGANGVFVQTSVYGSGVNRTATISNASAGNAYVSATTPAANTYGRGGGIVPLTSTRTIFWQVSNADISQLIINLVGYYS